jgi:hypothetical protein
MLLYLSASIFALGICIASTPAAVRRANRVHVLNGRKPDAGVAVLPDAILMAMLWCAGTWGLDHFLGRTAAWGGLLGISGVLLVLTLIRSRSSAREFQRFLAEHAGNGLPMEEANRSGKQPE